MAGCCDPRSPRPDTLPVGGAKIGVFGLEEIFAAVFALGPISDEQLVAELLARFKKKNYVPGTAESEYAAALVAKFKETAAGRPDNHAQKQLKGAGEAVEIKVLGTGCKRCQATETAVKEALAEMNVPAEVKKIEDPGEIVSLGVMMTPGVIIDGKLKVSGRIPKKEEIKKWLQEKK